MDIKTQQLLEALATTHALGQDDYAYLIDHQDDESSAFAAQLAVDTRQRIYGNQVFIRGLIEVSNYCKNDCLYCGIRASNRQIARYRLSPEAILDCCKQGYQLGFRTFVLQGGEDPAFTDEMLVPLISAMKQQHPDCAITLSLGERPRESYQALFDAGADRYLLRHETATADHYAQLHPSRMDFDQRMTCLRDLKSIGFATGCGFMVEPPFQTTEHLAADLAFIQEFQPDMCGIGPFVPHHATPFAHHPTGSAKLTCFLLSLIRLIKPNILLPATTALGTAEAGGRERGILAGANVVMPNLSPADHRADYALYDNKLSSGGEAAEGLRMLRESMQGIGYELVVDRGDVASE